MAWKQIVLDYDAFLLAGGDPPGDNYTPTPDTVVIVCQDDQTGEVAWVSYAEGSEQPATERLNPDVPAEDYR